MKTKICYTVLLILLNISLVFSQIEFYLFGAVTSSSFQIKMKTSDGAPVQVSLNSNSIGTFSADADNYYLININSLTPSTTYAVNLSYNSASTTFSVKTFPGVNSNVPLTFAAGGNIVSNTKSHVFNNITSRNPEFFMLLGNIHNNQITSNDWTQYEANYIKAINLIATKPLFSTTPLVYVYDENDFPKISSGVYDSADVQAVTKAFRKIFPSYPLPSNIGAYQSFRHGSVLFLVTDSRAFLDINTGNLFGSTQVQWLVTQLTAAAQDPSISTIFITMTQSWNYVKSAYDWDMVKQNYYSILDSMSTEKDSVSQAAINNINFNRPTSANFKSVMMIVGEHTLAFDDGTWNNFGNFPIAMCGPIDDWQQCRGGPYSHGSFHNAYNQYCVFDVYTTSHNLPGPTVCVKAQGVINFKDVSKGEIVVWTYDTCYPDIYRGRVNLKCPIDFREKLINAGITLGANLFIYFIFFVVIYRISLKAFSFSKIKI